MICKSHLFKGVMLETFLWVVLDNWEKLPRHDLYGWTDLKTSHFYAEVGKLLKMKRQMEGNNMSLVPPISLPLQNLVLKYPRQWFMGKWKQLHWFQVIKGWRAMAENLFCGNVDWDYGVNGLRWVMSSWCWNSSLLNETETESPRVENVFCCFLFHSFNAELLFVVLKS